MSGEVSTVLWIARHGQSAGNVAAALAEANGQETIPIAEKDADVLLSPLGELQARALGSWMAERPQPLRPSLVLTSPYRRTRDTAAIVSSALVLPPLVTVDERLRERDLGIFDRLTRVGWQRRHPEQAELRTRLGKFHHRPPGGESWGDVIIRVRGLVAELRALCETQSVLVVTHQVVVACLCCVLEGLDDSQLLRLDATGIANCAVTSYARERGPGDVGFRRLTFNDTTPVEKVHAPVTTTPDPPVSPP